MKTAQLWLYELAYGQHHTLPACHEITRKLKNRKSTYEMCRKCLIFQYRGPTWTANYESSHF